MIYVLLLEQSKIYVGHSQRPLEQRFIDHLNSNGSRWTKKYRPLQVLHVYEGGPEMENEITLQMMEMYGWWNVRGGGWCSVEMTTCPSALLERQNIKPPPQLTNGAIQANMVKQTPQGSVCRFCSRCGRNSHLLEDCFANTDVNGNHLEVKPQVKRPRASASSSFTSPTPVPSQSTVSLLPSSSLPRLIYSSTQPCIDQTPPSSASSSFNFSYSTPPPTLPYSNTQVAQKPCVNQTRPSSVSSSSVHPLPSPTYANVLSNVNYNSSSPQYSPTYAKSNPQVATTSSTSYTSHSRKLACFRCGRDSHLVKDCYAATDINGALLTDKIPVTNK